VARFTLIIAVLLVFLGLAGFIGTGSAHPTALIPMYFGLALGIGGYLAISPDEKRRKLFMHVNVTIGLLGFLGATVEAILGYMRAASVGLPPDYIALTSKISMAGLLLVYVIMCVRSFIAARRSGKV